MQQLAVRREGDGFGLHRGIHRDPLGIAPAQCPGVVRHPQALGQQKVELVTKARAPMAEIRALVRKLMLEKRLAGEALEYGSWTQRSHAPSSERP